MLIVHAIILGTVTGGLARVYNSRAQAFAILKRDPHATPVLDVLTYYVDLMCWFLDGNRPVEVIARGQGGIFHKAGYSADDVTWAIVTFEDEGGKTRYTARALHWNAADREHHENMGFHEGWGKAADQLAELVARI